MKGNKHIFIEMYRLIEKQIEDFTVPWVTKEAGTLSPYRVLISCILSLRTKDKTTAEASKRLFRIADNPRQMVELYPKRIQQLIYPVGFYRNKARSILAISKAVLRRFDGRVPRTFDELISLQGVGRKTANLVLGLGYHIPAICVDTHVHRISNRLGLVRSQTPYDSEKQLEKIIPKRFWVRLNTVFVTFGQHICLPVSPFCGRCFLRRLCKRRGVKRSR